MKDLAAKEISVCRPVAIAETPEEAKQFREAWGEDTACPLLLLHVAEADSMSTVLSALEIIFTRRATGQPTAIFLADGPECDGYQARRRRSWNDQFASLLRKQYLDIQVYEYIREWRTRPPRVR